ncbi:hypothetical protein AYI87_10820 [Shewanella sp. KCT]|nr:hypothetical protein AYI87_10820 [Shewanella sp. KCT]
MICRHLSKRRIVRSGARPLGTWHANQIYATKDIQKKQDFKWEWLSFTFVSNVKKKIDFSCQAAALAFALASSSAFSILRGVNWIRFLR